MTADLLSASSVEQDTTAVLAAAVRALEEAGSPAAVVERLRRLARQVGEPCVIAVVGRTNAGKSTFVNALLRGDMAVVGNTETTATINYFVFGEPPAGLPVRCHWRNGRVSDEPAEFLASLQGRDVATLECAAGIVRLEYLSPNPMLRGVTLVDTPGTGAAVTEHQARTEAFLDLSRRLRERHDAETERIHDAADAIVYLVGAVARVDDHQVLEQFAALGRDRARAMNALGVIAKVDLSAALLHRRDELAGKIGRQLEAELNTVVPVSAGLSRALDRLSDDALAALAATVRRIPAPQRELLLQNEELFVEYEPAGCPVGVQERRALRQSVPAAWRVFVTIVEAAASDGPAADGSAADGPAADGSAAELRERLARLAGFDRLRGTLREHFLQRAGLLRCYRILVDARRLLSGLRFDTLLPRRRRAEAEAARLRGLLATVDGLPGDVTDLRAYLAEQLDAALRSMPDEQPLRAVETRLGRLLRGLEEENADFTALRLLDGAPEAFSADETTELRALLGMFGTETSRRLRDDLSVAGCARAQLRWRITRDGARRGSPRELVADRAYARLGFLLDELDTPATTSPESPRRVRARRL